MVDRTMPRVLPFRQNVSWHIYDQVNRRTCLHVDAWVYQMPDDALYFAFLYSIAGTQRWRSHIYLATRDGATDAGDMDLATLERDGIQRTINTPWSRRHAPWLDAIHARFVAPTIRQRHPPFKSMSVWLHYIRTDLGHDNPMHGIENMYAVTDRAARDVAQMRPDKAAQHVKASAESAAIADMAKRGRGRPRSPYTKEERSILRTLDKLLK